MKKRLNALRYGAYSIELLLLFTAQATPELVPEIFGAKPVLLLSAALTISALESSLPAMIFGLVCGILCDFSSTGALGFFSLLITAACYAQASLLKNFMVRNFLNSIFICFCACVVIIGLYFVFFYIFPGFGGVGYYFVNHYLSRIIYTFVCCIPLYFLNMLLFKQIRAKQ